MIVQIIILLLVNFTPIQCNTNETTISVDTTMMTSTLLSDITISNWTSTVAGTITTDGSNSMESVSHSSVTITNSSTYTMPSTEHVTTINSSTSATATKEYPISSNIPTSAAHTISQPKNITYNLIYKFDIESSSPLKMGNITNSTVLNSIQNIVNSSFNLTDFIIIVIRAEIRSPTKSNTYEMFTNDLFQTSSNNCNETCIKNAALSSTPVGNFTLLANDNSLALASATSPPVFVAKTSDETTTTIINYQKGESPPGTAARLGMGLGITFVGVLLIAEVVYFYRKYGFNRPLRQSRYEVPSYHRRLSE